jgi:hypothetical protein
MIAPDVNRRSASRRPFAPILARSSGRLSRCWIASANAPGSRTGTSSPFTPLRTTARQPGTSVVTIARPAAHASTRLRGIPSPYEGRQTTAAARKTAGTSVRCPHRSTPDSAAQRARHASSNEPGFPSSGDPTNTKRARIPRARTRAAARQNSRIPFSRSMRDATTTSASPGGSGAGTNRARSTPDPRTSIVRVRRTAPAAINAARSSGFWKSVAARGARSEPRSSMTTKLRSTRVYNRREWNEKPRPVTTFIDGMPRILAAIPP